MAPLGGRDCLKCPGRGLWNRFTPWGGGSLHSQVEHHVRDKFATPILYSRVKFIFYDIFLHMHIHS